jgi:hypothetical protein
MRKTSNLRSFAIGSGDMSPVLVGITLSSSVASTATLVINPGFVYTDGLSGILRPQFIRPRVVGVLALVGVGTHFALFHGAGVANPGVSAAWGILVSTGLGFLIAALPEPAARSEDAVQPLPRS